MRRTELKKWSLVAEATLRPYWPRVGVGEFGADDTSCLTE